MNDLSDVGGDTPRNGGGRSGAQEADSLRKNHYDRLAKSIADMEAQRWWFRGVVGAVALIAMVAAGILEWVILTHILSPCSNTDDLFFILAVSPIVSITLIVIFMLMGVFRGFSEKDMERLPSSTASSMAGMNGN